MILCNRCALPHKPHENCGQPKHKAALIDFLVSKGVTGVTIAVTNGVTKPKRDRAEYMRAYRAKAPNP